MLDLAIVFALLVVVGALLGEIKNIASKLNKPKRGRGRPRKYPIEAIN